MRILISVLFLLAFLNAHTQKKVVNLDIEKNDDFSTFAMLDSVGADYSVFFTGENHNFRTSNYKLQLKMMKYLYKNFGVNHLFLEFGVSRGWLVNNYVQTGDSSLFKILKNYSYDEYALLYKELMLFNKTLPADKKIMIHGIDIERSYSTPIKVLSMLLPKNKPPKSIQLNIESIRSLAGKVDEEHVKDELEDSKTEFSYKDYSYLSGTKNFSTESSLEAIVRDFDSLRADYEFYLGDNSALFGEIIKGISTEFKRDKMLRDKNIQSYIFREQFMYDQLLSLIQKYPGEKFYGQFGRCHTSLEAQDKWCDFYFFNSLANRINSSEEPELKNKVLSIGIYYPESNTFEINAADKDKLNKLFAKYGNEGIKLMEIDKSDSALFKGVSDKYQFLILNFEGFKVEETKYNSENTFSNKKNKFEYGYIFPGIEGHYGFFVMNLKNLNSTFGNYGLPNMDAPQKFYGFAATIYEDWFMYGSVSAHIIPKSTNNYNDSSSLSFGGLFVKGYFGYDITGTERFNIIPRLGVGYGQLSFQQRFNNPLGNGNNNTIFSGYTATETTYSNSAFLIDPSIDIRLNIRYISLGLNLGYQIDLSEKNWIGSNQGIIGGAPATSLSGFYAAFTLSLFYSFW